MKKIALTGSIAMGKTYTARIFKQFGVKVFDSDLAVKEVILQQVDLIARSFPSAFVNNLIDKNILADIIFKDPQKRELLEEMIHPLVAKKRENFIKKARYRREKIILCDMALLFEKKYQRFFNQTIVVSAPKFMQSKRALDLRNISQDRLEEILKLQMPDHKKRIKADFVIYTGANRSAIYRQVKSILL